MPFTENTEVESLAKDEIEDEDCDYDITLSQKFLMLSQACGNHILGFQ